MTNRNSSIGRALGILVPDRATFETQLRNRHRSHPLLWPYLHSDTRLPATDPFSRQKTRS